MIKFSKKFKNPCFWPIFPIFGVKRFFKKNPALSCTRLGPLTPCWVSEKSNEPIPRKLPDRRKDRWTDPILQDPSGYPWGSNNVRNSISQLNQWDPKQLQIRKNKIQIKKINTVCKTTGNTCSYSCNVALSEITNESQPHHSHLSS